MTCVPGEERGQHLYGMMHFKECYRPSGGVTSPFSRGSFKFMRYCGRICRRLSRMDQKDSFPGVLK